jgi:ribosomal protein S18
MQQFQITLKNEKVKFYNKFAIYIFLLNAIGICIMLYYSRKNLLNINSRPLLAGTAVVLFTYQFIALFRKTVPPFLQSILISTFAISLFWTLFGFWWIGVFTFGLVILYVIAKREINVKVDCEKILFPSFPVKNIKWNELNNLILKDGLLTIDFKSNKILQHFVEEDNKVNEKEFNEFCRQQLNK